MINTTNPELKDELVILWPEAKELNLDFNKIYQRLKEKK